MLSPPRKPKDQDPDAPDTGFSALSAVSLTSSDLDSIGFTDSTGAHLSSFADQFNIEEEGLALSGAPVDTSTTTITAMRQAIANPTLAAWTNQMTIPLPTSLSQVTMPVAEAMELPAAPPGSKRVTSERELPLYQVVDGMIVLSNPERVKAPDRIDIIIKEFGTTNDGGKTWTRDDIAFKFKDMIGHGKICLVHNKVIKSGSNWHCKHTDVTCAPCKVRKVLKQIGTNLHVAYQGGIPRMMLDLATFLNINKSVDYRDLQLIFKAVTALGNDVTSCGVLWAACLQDASGNHPYLVANKRFYGCFMHPIVDHRPGSDKAEHSPSKGLANLWHETKIWRGGRYVTFTHTTRYMNTGDKMEERSAYKKDVIDASTQHVKNILPDWVELAKKAWEELESVRTKFCKKASNKKRKGYEEDEEEDEPEPASAPPMPGLPMPYE